MKIKKILLAVSFLFFLGGNFFGMPSKSFALEQQNINPCENAMIVAVSNAELTYTTEVKKFLNLKSSQAAAKAKSVPMYLKNYQCELDRISSAIKNPKSSNLSGKYSGCEAISGEAFATKMNVSFESCTNILQQNQQKLMSRSEKFIAAKKTEAKNYAEKEFYKTSSKENQGFLSGKILDMQKRMKVLLGKIEILSGDFNKVMADIKCTIPDSSY